MMMKLQTLLSILLLLSLGCAAPQKTEDKVFPRFHEDQVKTESQTVELEPIPLWQRLSWPTTETEIPAQTQERLFSFFAKDMPLRQAVNIFARSYNINVIMDEEIKGNVSVEFHDLPFAQAMKAMLGSLGYYWHYESGLLQVKSWETRIFTIDYIRLTRFGVSSSEAQVSSGSESGSESDSGGSGSKAGKISIEQENKIEFWKDLADQLKQLVSKEGRLVINKIAGTVQITDKHPRVVEISRYIEEINHAIQRQVEIEVKIFEVTLNDDHALGVDWSRLVSPGETGGNVDLGITNIITSPVGTGTALPSTINLTATNVSGAGANNLTSVISALEEQGEVQIVSQPHIRTMNNQSALIKVGTDRTFFRRELNTDNTSAGSTTTTTDVPQVVTEGIVLSITPQISREGWVMMDISPVVTRVSSVSEVKDGSGNVESSAPNLDIRQTSSLVRAFNGETVIIGGLIQTQEARSDRGVPGLNRVPGIGGLFRGEYKSVVRKEMIIFLTPKLVDPRVASSEF